MSSTFLDEIDDSIKYNFNRPAVIYYHDNLVSEISYKQLSLEAFKIVQQLNPFFENQWGGIILYVKITKTFPILFLSLIKTDVYLISLEEGLDNEQLLNYFSEFNCSFILSNCLEFEEQNPLYKSINLREKFVVLGECISLWLYEKSSFPNLLNAYGTKQFMYSIKTSGTTGRSKTIKVTPDSIIPNIKDLSDILQINCEDVILLMTPVTFDPSVIEVLLSLYNGCALCILDKKIKEDPQKIINCLFSESGSRVSILQTTPSILKRWNASILKNVIFHSTSSLRAVVLGGEEFPSSAEIISWNPSPHINIYNIYGITEVSCWASINKVWPSSVISTDIGKPLSQTVLKLENRDENNEGELLIGSRTRICLIGNEKKEDIFKDGALFFRTTGDIFKEINGKLFFVGRKDDIVKRWGTRFCLSEIEKVAREHNNTLDCACVYIKLPTHVKVCLFIVQKSDHKLKCLSNFMKQKLPKASWPDEMKILPSLPLTNHGKICKTTLKKLCSHKRKRTMEEIFFDLWQQYIGPDTNSESDFMSAGGDSFTALQFVNELKYEFGELPDTFLGLLFQKKSKNEIWDIISNSYTNICSEKKFREERNDKRIKHAGTSDVTNILRTYLKGRVTDILLTERQPKTILSLKIEETEKYNLGKCVDASPLGITFSNGSNVVIIGSHSGDVIVIDIDNLNVISKCTLPNRIESSACISPCGNFYYIGCYDGCMHCINLDSGMVVWSYQTNDMIKSTAVLLGTDIVFGSYDRCIYRISKEGKLIWKSKLMSPILTELIVDKYLYSATLGSVACLIINTGELLWEHSHHPIFSTPVINENCLIIADVKGKVQWLNKKTGIEEFSFIAGDMIFSALVKKTTENEEIIFFGCNDFFIYCLKNRALHWKTSLDSKIVSTPFMDFPNFIACFSSKGRAYLLDFNTGRQMCDYSLPGEIFSSPVIIKNRIVIGCRDDYVYILEIKQC